MDKLKQEYNEKLKRYFNGCSYLSQHIDEYDKYGPELERILDDINHAISLIEKVDKITEEEILNGFIKQKDGK